MSAPDIPSLTDALRRRAASETPGRTGELIHARIAQLLGAPSPVDDDLDAQVRGWPNGDDFSEAERAVLTVAEQMVVDAHGVGDDDVARLRHHYEPATVVALLMHIGLVDGFTKYELMRTSRSERVDEGEP